MKVVVFTAKNASPSDESRYRIGLLVHGDKIAEFTPSLTGVHATELLEFYDLDTDWIEGAKDAIEDGLLQLIDIGDVKIAAPVPRPGKIICIGLNYRNHAIESGMEIPKSPIIFSKFQTCVIGPDEPIRLPLGSEQVDYEAELAFIVGRRAQNVTASDAMDYVFGYTNFNDVSARDFQLRDGQWQRGKSCDTFAPMGPFVATRDEIGDPHNLRISFRLNGETLQDSTTAELIFGIPALIEFLSASITLEPGDVIATGTPPGVGFARKPPVFLKNGDIGEVEIENLGTLSNPVVG